MQSSPITYKNLFARPADIMEQRIQAAVAARTNDLFIVARTDALGVEGLDAALKRAGRYLAAGAEGLYVEAPTSVKEIERIGAEFKGVPQMPNMFEGDNETPWLAPMELYALGFSMILYPTSLLFRVVKTLQRALADLRQGKRMPKDQGVDLVEYEAIVDVPYWACIEKRFGARPN